MPVIFPVIKSVLSDAISKAIAPAQRYFLPMDPVLNSYGELDSAFVPSGNFEIEALVSTTATGSQMTILRGTGNDHIALDIAATDVVRFWARVGGVVQTIISGSTINDGDLHLIRAVYTGTTAELFIDGVSQGTTTWALNGSQDLTEVGRTPGGSNYFDGYLANIKTIDSTTAANSRIFPLAVGAGTTENSTINSGSITINNIPDNTRELFTFDEANNQWVANDGSPTIGVA